MRTFSEKLVRRTINRWNDPLKLTPDQILQYTQLLRSKADAAQPSEFLNPAALQSDLLQILTPQQKAEFEHIQTREYQARLELRVQAQLSQVESMFDLSEAQKDQIFLKFAEMEQTADSSTPTSSSNRSQNRQVQAQKGLRLFKGYLLRNKSGNINKLKRTRAIPSASCI